MDIMGSLAECNRCFAVRGTFRMRLGESISQIMKQHNVPQLPGVYVYYGMRSEEPTLLYIGRAGTVCQDGRIKEQGLLGRLKNTHNNMPRQKVYESLLQEWDELLFCWWVTFDETIKILPAKAEADLLQFYFDAHQRLPPYNKSA